MNLPSSPSTITAAYLESTLQHYTGEAHQALADFSVEPLNKGTSGAGLYVVTIHLVAPSPPLEFILKFDGGRKEVLFYRDLASRVRVGTPRVLDARLLEDGKGWLLMEKLTGVKDGLAWDEADYRAVLSEMARLHARYWRQAHMLDDCGWLWRPDEPALETLVAARKADVEALRASWLPQALPQVFGADILTLAERVLESPEQVFGPLLAAGTTLVHGDYWFHNVQLMEAGRQVLVDWQDVQVWSGLWELAYFLNLLLVVDSREYRTQLPIEETRMVGWYADALAGEGVILTRSTFDHALLAARVWHPIQHWVRQYGYALAHDLLPRTDLQQNNPQGVQFLAATFARWEQDAGALLDM